MVVRPVGRCGMGVACTTEFRIMSIILLDNSLPESSRSEISNLIRQLQV